MGNEPQKRKVGMRKVRRWIVAGMCNGLISATVGLSATKMGLSSRMVIGVVTNGVAGAVANGSQRLGLGLGSERRKWFATIGFGFWAQTVANGVAEAVANGSQQLGLSLGRTVANGVAGPSRMVLPDRREWFCRTVATGYRRRFRSYRRRWGSTAIGFGSEARRWLCLSLGFGFWKITTEWGCVKFLIYIYIKTFVTKLFSSL